MGPNLFGIRGRKSEPGSGATYVTPRKQCVTEAAYQGMWPFVGGASDAIVVWQSVIAVPSNGWKATPLGRQANSWSIALFWLIECIP